MMTPGSDKGCLTILGAMVYGGVAILIGFVAYTAVKERNIRKEQPKITLQKHEQHNQGYQYKIEYENKTYSLKIDQTGASVETVSGLEKITNQQTP